MSEIILVHGSCHGAWCWRDVIPELEALGHDVTAIDLPSHGDDTTPVETVTLDLYAEAIVKAIKGKAVLVGHSMGGYPITAAAELAPEKVERLIYLCAYVPREGMGLADMRRAAPRQPLLEAVVVDEARISFTVNPEMAVEKFYHDVAPETAAWAISNLCPQAILPQETALELRNSPSIARNYIRCLYDGAIPTEFQFTMTEGWPDGTVVDMATSHSPFFSDPKGVAAHIHSFTKG
ncbi:alpha/beta fold hydrolase [Marivivens sp. LCG002]|uniref:alpha/beta fold hydrolase n=1 Tax=Marivivens sp. LCG002 TaxID=3051171 RepID=UPI0025577198|nr:alpha/beta fold hydrolase [Marivivens sp. LCG002]WIV51163.1 alpha/beta fold hydrolase [Marivivens sp. LCG002]